MTGISAALVLPQYVAMRHDPTAPVGLALLIGTVLGALGVMFGVTLASGHSAKAARIAGMAVWGGIALVLSGGAALGVTHSAGWGWRVTLSLGALLPWAGPALLFRNRNG